MMEFIFVLTVAVILYVIVWASNTLKEEYRYKNTINKDTIEKAKLDKDDKKKYTVGGRP